MPGHIIDDGSDRIENGFEELGYALKLEEDYLSKVKDSVEKRRLRADYNIIGQLDIPEEYVLENRDKIDSLSQKMAKYHAASMAQQIAEDLRDDEFRQEFYQLNPFERTKKALEKTVNEDKFIEFFEKELIEELNE